MARKPKPATRDPSKVTGKPLSETVTPSHIYGPDNGPSSSHQNAENKYTQGWLTSPDLYETDLSFSPDAMERLSNFLLANPNMNASHLFRADILFDSSGELKTPQEKERLLALKSGTLGDENESSHEEDQSTTKEPAQQQQVETKIPPAEIEGLELSKTVVLTLIPRNLNLDKPMDQTCHFYRGTMVSSTSGKTVERFLCIRFPHIDSVEDMPFYHPRIRGFAFMYDFEKEESSEEHTNPGKGTLSLHVLPFPASEGFDPFPTRLERTLQALLSTQTRLARNTKPTSCQSGPADPGKEQVDDSYNPFQDNLIPRHLIQNTYTRLKLTYAQDLCQNWVESTEPSKHVFEDLSITAFLIELWRNMYGVAPKSEQTEDEKEEKLFPGFVDVACGNGVLVYILLMEGYKGWGFDARRRKTWSIFPDWVQQNLQESLYIPKPFAVACSQGEDGIRELTSNGTAYHTGEFPRDTFIISNHADELTVWTPLMAASACPEAPLPFVSIPCCSHSLSGARFRYPPPKKQKSKPAKDDDEEKEEEQPATGDLKALRKAKIFASTAQPGADLESTAVFNSMYGSLTAKTQSIAAEIGYDVEKTLLRIPSTRNMGVVGGRKSVVQKRMNRRNVTEANQDVEELIAEIIRRECAREGGIGAAANIWIQRAIGLQKGKKSGGGGHIIDHSSNLDSKLHGDSSC
jgi:tRNASer (uridine44-2'-O)-methyltransferase